MAHPIAPRLPESRKSLEFRKQHAQSDLLRMIPRSLKKSLMNPEEICTAVIGKLVSPSDAIAAMEKLGFDKEDAREQVFLSLGGDDIVYRDSSGVDRYLATGKSVEALRNKS